MSLFDILTIIDHKDELDLLMSYEYSFVGAIWMVCVSGFVCLVVDRKEPEVKSRGGKYSDLSVYLISAPLSSEMP